MKQPNKTAGINYFTTWTGIQVEEHTSFFYGTGTHVVTANTISVPLVELRIQLNDGQKTHNRTCLVAPKPGIHEYLVPLLLVALLARSRHHHHHIH
jgi:hypothetical protein